MLPISNAEETYSDFPFDVADMDNDGDLDVITVMSFIVIKTICQGRFRKRFRPTKELSPAQKTEPGYF